MCRNLCGFFHSALKEEHTDPEGTPNLARYRHRLIDMFMTDQTVKESIVKSFCTQLRIVICTIAFGMGVDCVNVHQIVHWGVASNVESYVQESGRAGRDGQVACATLFFIKHLILIPEESEIKGMIDYCRNKDCHSVGDSSYSLTLKMYMYHLNTNHNIAFAVM